MTRNPLIAARLFNTPLLVHPAKLDAIIAGLSSRLGLGPMEAPAPSAFTTQNGQWADHGLYRVVDGIAVLDVFGVLAHRGGMQADSSYILGYQTIAQQLDAAMADAEVRGVLLNMDSPGGEVAGAFDLARQIADYRGKKPIRAAVSDLAASAAYLIASAADTIAVAQNGYAGSIGVVMRHVDLSRALDQEGVRITHIFAGERKMDGNPYQPLPAEVQAHFQAEVDGIYASFVSVVAQNRGLPEAAVRGTQAAVYRGTAALDAGLADHIATPDQILTEMRAATPSAGRAVGRDKSRPSTGMNSKPPVGRDKSRPSPRGKPMNDENPDVLYTEADLVSAKAQAHEDGRQAGSKAEGERIFAVLNLPEAEGRGAQAIALAEAGLSAEQAAKVLAATPMVTSQTATDNPFARHMAALGNPDVGPASDAAPDPRASANIWGRAFGRA